ncbi:DUF2523 domain-containing protein [Shewanella sp. SM20]|uniref:DUF2523 family protein n=1 Tax=Shewanella sp. SM20 TaxID=2912792 RepID=UPI0021D7F527|nr:DUF2523 family protein [Shewanella sp. SM20]MCU8094257.1 DUF2523 domain-containing protein [Shewanella sp. SM20]
MKNLIIFSVLIILFFYSQDAMASDGISGFAQDVKDFFSDIWAFFTEAIPDMFYRLGAWLVEAIVYVKVVMMYQSMMFSWNIAKVILEDLQVSQLLMSALGGLPPSLRAFITDCRIVDGINVVLNAYATRFVMRVL